MSEAVKFSGSLGKKEWDELVKRSRTFHLERGQQARDSKAAGTENYGKFGKYGVVGRQESAKLVCNLAKAMRTSGIDMKSEFSNFPKSARTIKPESKDFAITVKKGNDFMIAFREKFLPGTAPTQNKINLSAENITWAMATMRRTGTQRNEKTGGSTASLIKTAKALGDLTSSNIPSELLANDKAGVMRAAKMMKVREDPDEFKRIFGLSDSECQMIENAISRAGLLSKYKDDLKNVVLSKENRERKALYSMNQMSVDYLFMIIEWFYLAGIDADQYGNVLLNFNQCCYSTVSDRKIMKWVEGKAKGFKSNNGNPVWEKLWNAMNALPDERELYDNPFKITKGILCAAISIWGSVPIAVNGKSLIGFNELFIMDCFYTNEGSPTLMTAITRMGPLSSSHVVHRGIFGSPFMNISRIAGVTQKSSENMKSILDDDDM